MKVQFESVLNKAENFVRRMLQLEKRERMYIFAVKITAVTRFSLSIQ